MITIAIFVLLAFVVSGLIGVGCWALLWIWAEREDPKLYEYRFGLYARDPAFYPPEPWIYLENCRWEWPERPSSIYDREVDDA